MTIEQKSQVASQIIETACRIYAPKDTGRLSLFAIRSVYEDGIWQVVIGGEVAPYAVFTNETWINRKGKNPNEHWVERAIESVKDVIIGIFSGSYSMDDITAYQDKIGLIEKETITNFTKGVIE